MNDARSKPERSQPTPESFERFLSWLDNGKNSEGRSYLEMRKRLVAYFERKKCSSPDELADETLTRVSRRLDEQGSIESESPAHYCYITARYIFLESLRRPHEVPLPPDETRNGVRVSSDTSTRDEAEKNEVMLTCLESCASKLEESSRDLIYGYYFGKAREKIDNRRSIAKRLGISVNALAIKACRIRTKLEACVGQCAGMK
jgi:DNA-directed RNA polymerase specialized sigma24 family protein